MECFYEEFGFYPDDHYEQQVKEVYRQEEETLALQYYEHHRSKFFTSPYPDHFYIPTNRFEVCGQTVSIWKKHRYSPYQRISHFREHLNRIQGCQFVTVPDSIMKTIQEDVKNNYRSSRNGYFYDDLYQFVKGSLRRRKWTHYNEHIHYMIHQSLQTYVSIKYDDFQLVCQIFKQLEQAFTKWNTHEKLELFELQPRKNLFSYYLVVQTLLYMFHYHPHYQLPTLHDESKRKKYYVLLLALIQSIPMGEKLFYLHFERKKQCPVCVKGFAHLSFDTDLIQLL